jgi:proline iminopeptidase
MYRSLPSSFIITFFASILLSACFDGTTGNNTKTTVTRDVYFDNTGRDDVISGGVKMIPVSTPAGEFKVWTKRVGNNPDIKVLILHGGPGGTHEYLEAFDSYFPGAGIEYYHYDQLGSYYSDQPGDTSLWTIERFVEEVEQVRQALGLNKDNFYIVGQSWGGILGLEYALKYQEHIKGLVISNMMCSAPAYNTYAHEKLGPGLGEEIYGKIKAFEEAGEYANPEYISIIEEHHYPKHVLRMPLDEWPEPVVRMFKHLNPDVYVRMQGPSEFGIAGNATLRNWDRSEDLGKITVPTLTIGAQYDTMDPEHMEWMAGQLPNGSYLHCPNGSHLPLYDDAEVYFSGLIDWIREVNSGS